VEQNHTANQRYYANIQNGRSFCGGFLTRNMGSDDRCTLRDREPVQDFTDSSRKRFARYLRNAASRYRVFITLTYPPGFGQDGHACKRDLAAFGRRYRRFCESTNPGKDYSLVWWQEWQGNGRVHLHLLGTHRAHYKWIAQAWFDIVGSGNDKHLQAGTQIKKLLGKTSQIISYATKYAVKNEQKQVPESYSHPGRFWGVMGNRTVVSASTTWSAFQHDDPDVLEARETLKSVMESAEKAGKVNKIVIEKDEYRLVMRVWDPDDAKFRELLKFHMSNIEKVIANDKQRRFESLHPIVH